jgi:hypothetical protein
MVLCFLLSPLTPRFHFFISTLASSRLTRMASCCMYVYLYLYLARHLTTSIFAAIQCRGGAKQH